MKQLNGVLAVMLELALNLVAGSPSANAQTNASISDDDFATMLEALEMTTPTPASELPNVAEIHGFYSAKNPDWPPMPADVLDLPVWPLGDGMYVLNDTNVNYAELAQSEVAGRFRQDDVFSPDFGFSTNDLSLDIVSESNGIADLVINPPWDVSNGVYDLLETTNLTSLPINWQWVLRNAPGQTNVYDPNATNAQEFYGLSLPNDFVANDSEGTNFWGAFFNLSIEGGEVDLSLYISSPVGATGTVTIPGLGISTNFSVAAGGVTNIGIPMDVMIPEYYAPEVTTNGIHVIASQPVSVYAFDYVAEASAAFNCYPTPFLGTNYCLMAGGAPFDSGFKVALVAAAAGTTTVTVTPSAGAEFSGIGITYTTNLQVGETIQFNVDGDPTGTTISSSAPIGVVAGVPLADVPNSDYGAGNPLIQEQLPVESWGVEALALSFAGRKDGDTYRILAAYSNTVVTITTTNGDLVVTNQAGEFYETNGLSGPVEFQGDQPIQVAHFANGTAWDNLPNHEGDPCEILVPPTGYYLESNVVFTLTTNLNYTTGDFNESFVTIIATQSAITNTFVDNASVSATNFMRIGNSGYYGAQISISATNSGPHTVTSSQPIGLEVYGWGNADSYGYFGGVVK